MTNTTKCVIRPWHNIDNQRERILSAWEDFKAHPSIKRLMQRIYGYGDYEEFMLNGATHEDACDSVLANAMLLSLTEATPEAQLAEAREMLGHYQNKLRQVKAQRDALLEQLKIAYQWLSVVPKTYAPHHEQMQGIRAAIALTQKRQA